MRTLVNWSSDLGADRSPNYNLFRNKAEPHLVCAICEDRPVPSFIRSETWEFMPRGPGNRDLMGFNHEKARLGDRLNGFFLFDSWCLARSVASPLSEAA